MNWKRWEKSAWNDLTLFQFQFEHKINVFTLFCWIQTRGESEFFLLLPCFCVSSATWLLLLIQLIKFQPDGLRFVRVSANSFVHLSAASLGGRHKLAVNLRGFFIIAVFLHRHNSVKNVNCQSTQKTSPLRFFSGQWWRGRMDNRTIPSQIAQRSRRRPSKPMTSKRVGNLHHRLAWVFSRRPQIWDLQRILPRGLFIWLFGDFFMRTQYGEMMVISFTSLNVFFVETRFFALSMKHLMRCKWSAYRHFSRNFSPTFFCLLT